MPVVAHVFLCVKVSDCSQLSRGKDYAADVSVFMTRQKRGEILLGKISGSVHEGTPPAVHQCKYLCCYSVLLFHQKFSSFGDMGQSEISFFFELRHVSGAKRDKNVFN